MRYTLRRIWRRARWSLIAAIVTALLATVLMFGWVNLIDWPAIGRWGRPRLPWLVLFALALAFVATGAVRAVTNQPPRRGRLPGLSWWVVVLAAGAVVVAVSGATDWLLFEADSAVDRGAARVDAIKTGLGVGAGTAGIFALLLAVRRQIHQEHTAADTVLDATEKRVTELYTKAADQLGSGNAAVRLAGLYALARLADNHVDQEDTILNVICAYLRMPYHLQEEPSSDESPDEFDRRERNLQEAQVRLTAQRILRDHVHKESDSGWGGIVDLTNANIAGIDLEDADLVLARLAGANLARANLRDANLAYASLLGADLAHAELNGADLENADLTDANLTHANLDGTNLEDAKLARADFTGARLPAGLEFRNGLIVRT